MKLTRQNTRVAGRVGANAPCPAVGLRGAAGRAVLIAALVGGGGLAAAQPATQPGQGDLTSGGQPAGGQVPPAPVASPNEAAPPSGDLTPSDVLMLSQDVASSDGSAFEVGTISLVYDKENPGNPPLDVLMNVEFELLSLPEGWVAARENVPSVRMTLAQLNEMPARTMYSSAINAISARLVNTINTRYGVVGTYIRPIEVDLAGGQDSREGGATGLTLGILLAEVSEVRTIGTGRVPQDERRINNPLHARIRGRSPVQPGGPGGGGLIRRDLLDDYVLRLNRHPGRRVDVAVAPGEQEGQAVLDFLVSESKPWSVYFQVSNTGTEQTNEWRERLGFVHNELTNHDDILSIDFITAAFDESNALTAAYDARVFDLDRLRWNVSVGWDDYTASDVAVQGDEFKGESWNVGAGLTWNVYQHREFFVDLLGGVRFEHQKVDPGGVSPEGEEDLWFPYIGVRADRTTDTDSWSAMARVEFQPGADEDELERLGRTSPDDSWVILQAQGDFSFFLDPLFYGRGWSDVRTDGPDYDSTLAHELVFSLKGQTSLGSRVIPQVQQVAGGLYTVRGYDESIATGDDTLLFSMEYQFHLPRSFAAEEPTRVLFGRPFKVSPQQPFGRPDWDLIFRGFVDVGKTWVSDATTFEQDQTLIGAGVGAELQVLRNFGLRVDVGWALQDVKDENDDFLAETGDVRVHFLMTLLF